MWCLIMAPILVLSPTSEMRMMCRYGFLSQVLWLPIHQEFVDSGHFFLHDRLGSAIKK